MDSKRFYEHAQNLWKTVWGGELGGPKCVGKLGWFNREVLELACPTTCACLFKVRPGLLSKTLSHMGGKLKLPTFLFNVGLLTLINMDSLMFLAEPCPFLPIIWKLFWLVGWPVWLLWWWMGRGPSGALWTFLQMFWRIPLCIHHHR